MKWSNTKAIVTGGASGLGLAVVERIIAKGGKAAIFDSDIGKAEDKAFSLGDGVIALQVDVTSERSVADAVKEAKGYMGHLNLLVNCAGISQNQKVISSTRVMSLRDFERTISVNLIGSFIVCREVGASMRDNMAGVDEERGLIINTASIAAFEGQIGQVAYSASKGAIASMTLPLARELAGYNIRVMCIAPGVFDTSIMGDEAEEVRMSITNDSLYPHRMGEPEEFAALVQHILENSMLNGSVIRLDGGLRMPAM